MGNMFSINATTQDVSTLSIFFWGLKKRTWLIAYPKADSTTNYETSTKLVLADTKRHLHPGKRNGEQAFPFKGICVG